MSTSEQVQIFFALKKVLKSKDITYASLGKEMKMSESSIKRIFSTSNCSLEKLMEICGVLEISLSQLTDLYNSETLPQVKVSIEMERFFLNNPHYFSFLRQLSLYRSVNEVRKKNGLSVSSSKKYIAKLQEFGLVKKKARNEYDVVRAGFLKISANGELKQKLTAEWSRDILEKSLKKDDVYQLQIASTRLKAESIDFFKGEIKKLVKQLRSQGHLENLVSDNEVSPFGVCLVSGPQIVDFTKQIPNI